jgi:hypothetical protein
MTRIAVRDGKQNVKSTSQKLHQMHTPGHNAEILLPPLSPLHSGRLNVYIGVCF